MATINLIKRDILQNIDPVTSANYDLMLLWKFLQLK